MTQAHPDPAPGTTEVADLIAAAVLAVPGVHSLHGGASGAVATYLPGRRVEGVRVREDRCAVHVAILWGTSVTEVTDLVRAATTAYVDVPVDVTVEDLVEVGP